MRLNGWQRIGIVLSILWALGAGLYSYNAHLTRAEEMTDRDYRACVAVKDTLNRDCTAAAKEVYQYWSQWKWSGTAIAALAPIPVIWLLVYIVVCTARWIRRGFEPAA
jgi:hypothetical protein